MDNWVPNNSSGTIIVLTAFTLWIHFLSNLITFKFSFQSNLNSNCMNLFWCLADFGFKILKKDIWSFVWFRPVFSAVSDHWNQVWINEIQSESVSAYPAMLLFFGWWGYPTYQLFSVPFFADFMWAARFNF